MQLSTQAHGARKRSAAVVLLVIALAFGVMGCSKDEPVSNPPATTSATSPSGTSGTSGTSAANPQIADFCAKFKDFGTRIDSLSDTDPAAFATAKSFFQQLADAAPEAIKADMATFNNWVQNVATPDQNPPAEIAPAAGRIGTWAGQNCAK